MNDSSSELGFPWSELDLAATRDISEIQRAYARRLKTIDLARERDAFLALRRAYEAALVAAADEIEPLPEASKLWTLPNVIITPHVGAQSARRADDTTNLICENLRRYFSGQPLLNLVDKVAGY